MGEYENTGECEVNYNGQTVFFDYVYRAYTEDFGDSEIGPYVDIVREELTIIHAYNDDGDELPYDAEMFDYLEKWVKENEDLRE